MIAGDKRQVQGYSENALEFCFFGPKFIQVWQSAKKKFYDSTFLVV